MMIRDFQVTAFLMLLAGCSSMIDLPGPEGRSCDSAGACLSNYHCENNVCVPGPAPMKFSLVVNVESRSEGSGVVSANVPEFNCSSTSCTASVVIGGQVTLTAQPGAQSAFWGWSGDGCSGTGPCTLSMDRARAVTASFGPGFQLEVILKGGGEGTVTSFPPGIQCPGTCKMSFPAGTYVSLTAKPALGSYFPGWEKIGSSLPFPIEKDTCGSSRFCNISLDTARTLNPRFETQNYNLCFVSSQKYLPNFGSLEAADRECNRLATEAGINNAAGDGFIAALSTNKLYFRDRLASVRGFVQVDSQPVADDSASLFDGHRVFTPLHLDENGRDVGPEFVWTGTSRDGRYSNNSCTNWTTTDVNDIGEIGSTMDGPARWIDAGAVGCAVPRRIYCFGKAVAPKVPLTPSVFAGSKQIFLSNTVFNASQGVAAADAKCLAERPVGVARARALLSTTSAARYVLEPETLYARPDGQTVGKGSQIMSNMLVSGIWQNGAGAYLYDGNLRAWTGSPMVTNTDSTLTCGGWSSTSGNGAVALVGTIDPVAWWRIGDANCTSAFNLYCVEY